MKELFIAIIVGISCLFLSCENPQQPVFKTLENVRFKSFSIANGGSVTLSGDALFHNPNMLGADVSSVDLDVYINGKMVTNVVQDVHASMSGNSDFTLPLNFKVPLKDTVKDFKSSINDIFKKKLVEYQLDGHIKAGLGSVQVSIPVKYEGEEELRLK
ncbi:MAG: LEA14-like dessication related protein [Paraglaciecola sp.]|jgi:LEA14-like dessication related protein